MNEVIKERFLECYDLLRANGRIKSSAQFAREIGIVRQSFNEILKGRRELKVDMIGAAITNFHFNPQYLFSGNGDLFADPDKQGNSDQNIVMMPVRAQAGYINQYIDPVFKTEWPKFSLPIPSLKDRPLVAFEVQGESMIPTLEDGHIVVCSKLDPNYYAHSIKDGKVYVIITFEEILIKRCENKIHPQGILKILSDNNAVYPPDTIKITKVREMWQVEAIIKTDIPGPTDMEDVIARKIKEVMADLINKEKI